MFIKSFKQVTEEGYVSGGFLYPASDNYDNPPASFENMPESGQIQLISRSEHLPTSSAAYLKQIHSSIVLETNSGGFKGDGDGLFSRLSNIILTIRVADCIPILIFSRSQPFIAAIHSGWRGLYHRILQTLANNIQPDESFTFVLGPHLKKCHFEVTSEFLNYFEDKYFQSIDNKIFFDSTRVVKDQILDFFGPQVNIIDFSSCTFCDARTYSYRRDKTNKRQIAYIVFHKKEGE
ncbi:MAG: peptidoglycan editing factor PgeF [Calditrichia bacterium]